jgi:mRNA interferase RelE/StbE
MAYRVLLRRSAARELSALPQPMRVRVGDYRVLYQVDDDRVVVLVVRVRHRSIAYRSR